MLGRHDGHHGFTVGQRRGIGVAAEQPLYVLDKEPDTGRVVVGTREELATTTVALTGARLHRPAADVRSVRLRYHAEPLPCRAVETPDGLRIELERPAHAVAPGQLACLLSEDIVIGHGTIAREARW